MKNSTEAQVNYSSYTNVSLNYKQYYPNLSHTASLHDMNGRLGFGIGRILREAFNYAYGAWQGWWYPPRPSVETVAWHRQAAIYRQGLEVVVTQLEVAIENLRKNSRDPASLERVKQIMHDKDYANYFKPAQTEKLRAYQTRLFKAIHEKVQRFKVPHLKEIVQGYLSTLQTEITPLAVASTLPIPTEIFSEKTQPKRSITQQPAIAEPILASTLSVTFEPFFNLTTLNGDNGFVVGGLNVGDELGISVSTAGDVNGDGKADLILGAWAASPGGRTGAGTVYVLFDKASNWSSKFNLTTLNGSNGFAIDGLMVGGNLGVSVNTAGDLNGDGIADLVLGAREASPGGRIGAGAAYVLFGQTSGWSSRFNLTTLTGSNGFAIEGLNAGDYLGNSGSMAGDINLDGITDLVLGASPGGFPNTGKVYVLFGKKSGWMSQFNLTTLNGDNGFAIDGVNTSDALGFSVNTAGDINCDGKADLLLGAYGALSEGGAHTGAVYVLFGQTSWPSRFNLTTLNGSNGFTIEGLNAGDGLGWSVSTAGDVNGDGITDLLLGTPWTHNNTGTAYVLFGKNGTWVPQFNLTTLNGNNGFTVEGLNAGSYFGCSVRLAGDVNGDGKADLVLGAYQASSDGHTNAGAAYVLFGQASWMPQFNLTTLNGANGFAIAGINAGDQFGNCVSTAGDVNADGIADLVLGAYHASPGISVAGVAYVIFGKNATVVVPIPVPASPLIAPSMPIFPQPVATPAINPAPILSPNPIPLSLTACPINQPLRWLCHNIIIAKAQQLRLSPVDISVGCGNTSQPYEVAYFRVTGIRWATLQQRNANGSWNTGTLTFVGRDLAAGQVALLQDGSNIAPELNVTATDGVTTLLNQAIQVNFTLTDTSPSLISFQLAIPLGGTVNLTSADIVLATTNSKLSDMIISVENVQNGYFAQISAPDVPINEFTYYQIQTGQIQIVHDGNDQPITFNISVSDGLKSSLPELETVALLGSANNPQINTGMIAGATIAGGFMVAGALAAYGFYRKRRQQSDKEHEERKAQMEVFDKRGNTYLRT